MKSFRFFNTFSGAPLPTLVEAARFGDEVAYNELISRTYKSVKLYCASMTNRAEAADLAQEAYVRALKARTPILNTENIEAFMISVAKCVCMDYITAKKKVSKLTSKLSNERTYNNFEISIPIEISDISDEHKEILTLISVLGFSYQDVSDILNIPIGTVRSRYSRAKLSAKESITKEQYSS